MEPEAISLHGFDGPQERFARALEHRSRLEHLLGQFTRNEPREKRGHAIPPQLDPYYRNLIRKRSPDLLALIEGLEADARPWAMGLRRPTESLKIGSRLDLMYRLQDARFPFHAGVVLGDCVHNLRAALDNIVWEATVSDQAKLGVHPPPKRPFGHNSPWRHISFPLVTRDDPERWQNVLCNQLWGIRPDFQAVIEDHQPYVSWNQNPKSSPLYILNELWNIDKHHGINLIVIQPDPDALQLHPGTSFSPEEAWDPKLDAKVGTVQLVSQDAVDFYSPGGGHETRQEVNPDAQQMNVYLPTPLQIALGKGTKAEGLPVISTLWTIQTAVEQVLHDLRSARAQRGYEP